MQATTEPEPTATPTITPTPFRRRHGHRHADRLYGDSHAARPPRSIRMRRRLADTPLPPDNVNGIKLDQFVIMPPAVQENVKQIFAKGQALGNNAQRFSKVGDSIIEHPHYMVKFDTPDYNLGQYAYLQDVLNYYRGSYGRDSLSVRRGLHSWSWNNPTWADKDQCLPDEGPIACEYRVHKPSVSFIVLGSNDVGVPDYFRKSMEELVQFTIDQGVIPVIVTKADRHEGDSNINNIILKETAAKFNVPMLDFDAVAGTHAQSRHRSGGWHAFDVLLRARLLGARRLYQGPRHSRLDVRHHAGRSVAAAGLEAITHLFRELRSRSCSKN